ncbi:MAG: hypothetical protein LBS84_00670 [Clostridiales bacterium]|nr:hypothetical protein [Clostridiales bacterium]
MARILSFFGSTTQYDYVSSLPYVSQILVGGYSIGTVPAVYLAANREVGELFLLAPFANGYDFYNQAAPVFYGPLRLLVKHKFPSDQYAADIDLPVLIVASTGDEIIPYTSSKKLSACFAETVKFISLSGIGHNGVLLHPKALESIHDYLLLSLR